MTKVSQDNQVKLSVLGRKHVEEIAFRADFRARQEERLRAEVAAFRLDKSKLANELRRDNVPHRLIQDQISLFNWDAYKAFMLVGADTVKSVEQVAAEMLDAEPVEILEQEVHQNAGGPWIRFKAKESGVVGDIWANRSGNWDFSWDEVSPSRHEIQVWYSEKFGFGNV